MVIKDNGASLESLKVLPIDESTNDQDNLIGSEKTGLNEPNGFKQNHAALEWRPRDSS